MHEQRFFRAHISHRGVSSTLSYASVHVGQMSLNIGVEEAHVAEAHIEN